MIQSGSYWQAWKWGIAAVLFACAIVAIFALQYRSFQYVGIVGEVGKLGEVVQVEKEIGEVRERIERMEAQQKGLENQARFASIKLELTEERQIQSSSFGTRLRTAIADGYRAAIENTIEVTLATLRYGPTVVDRHCN